MPRKSDQVAVREALTAALRDVLDADAAAAMHDGYVDRLEDNLLPRTPVGVVRDAFGAADGGELEGDRPKMHAAYSSAALVANTFGPFVEDPTRLRVAGMSGFTKGSLERRLPIFVGGRAPNLDVVLESDELLVAIESKLTEHFGRRHAPKMSDAYARPEIRTKLVGGWEAVLDDLLAGAEEPLYEHLDIEQLVKHALGVAKAADGRDAALVYLYWEPSGDGELEATRRHREELEDLRGRLGEACFPRFVQLSYAALLDEWEAHPNDEDDSPELVDMLRTRYVVEVS